MTFTGWLLLFVLAGAFVSLAGARDWAARSQRLWGALAIAAGALAFGRAGYLALNAEILFQRPDASLGAAAAGFLAQAAWVGGWLGWRVSGRRIPASSIAIAGLLAAMGVSLGCAQAGCAYGREVSFGDGLLWALRVDWPDAYSLANPRIPAQLILAAWMAIGCLGLATRAVRRPSVDIIALATLWLGVGDALVQWFQADPTPVWAGLRAGVWLDGILVLSAVAALLRHRRHAIPPPP